MTGKISAANPPQIWTNRNGVTCLRIFSRFNWDTLVRPVPRYAELLALRGENYTLAKLDYDCPHLYRGRLS